MINILHFSVESHNLYKHYMTDECCFNLHEPNSYFMKGIENGISEKLAVKSSLYYNFQTPNDVINHNLQMMKHNSGNNLYFSTIITVIMQYLRLIDQNKFGAIIKQVSHIPDQAGRYKLQSYERNCESPHRTIQGH